LTDTVRDESTVASASAPVASSYSPSPSRSQPNSVIRLSPGAADERLASRETVPSAPAT
jgi:hypothetical protein